MENEKTPRDCGRGGPKGTVPFFDCNDFQQSNVECDEKGDSPHSHFITIEVEADGFLYNMVRTIVGTLVEVGVGRKPESWPGEVLLATDRRIAGPTAPPQGLFLVYVEY